MVEQNVGIEAKDVGANGQVVEEHDAKVEAEVADAVGRVGERLGV